MQRDIRRRRALDPGYPLGSALRVSVVADAQDEDASIPICAALQREGAVVRLGGWSTDDDAIVVVLSSHLLASGTLVPGPEDAPAARLVPVARGPVDASAVPAALAALNWILWREDAPQDACAAVASACTTDLGAYRSTQAILARAEGWNLGGRQATDLISDRGQLASAEAALGGAGDTSAAILTDYLHESVIQTRRTTWRGIRRLVTRGVLALALVFAGSVVFRQVTYMNERRGLELVASADDATSFYPAANAVKVAGLGALMTEHGDPVPESTMDTLVLMLSEPWPEVGSWASQDGTAINDMLVLNDGSVLFLDGNGALWRSDVQVSPPERMASLVTGVGDFLAASSSGEVVAGATFDEVVVLRPDGRRDEFRVTEQILGLELDSAGTTLVVEVEGGVRLIDLTSERPRTGELIPDVLATATVDGHPLGLRRSADSLQLVRLTDGTIQGLYRDPTGPLSMAAIGPSGRIVVQGADGQLHTAVLGQDLLATGLRVPDQLASLAVTESDEVLYTPMGWNTHIVDLARGIPLADTCRESTARALSTSPDGRWVVCGYGAGYALWDLDDLRPLAVKVEASPALQAAGEQFVARITDGGLLEVSAAKGQQLWDLTGTAARQTGAANPVVPRVLQMSGELTTLAAVGGSLAVGSSSGQVLVADVGDDGFVRAATRWEAPDRAAVRSITVEGSTATVTTVTATWQVSVCPGCSTSFPRIVEHLQTRWMACYVPSLTTAVPQRILDRLSIQLCAEE